MSRATDIYFEIEQELKRILPAQSFLPNQIYRAITRSQIWLCSNHDALRDEEKITIISDVKEYLLTKTFKRILKLLSPDSVEYSFTKPEYLAYAISVNNSYYYTFDKDKIIFATNQNNFAGQEFTLHGFTIPNTEVSETQDLVVPILFDDAIKYYSLYLLMPLEMQNRIALKIEAEGHALIHAGKNNNQTNSPESSISADW